MTERRETAQCRGSPLHDHTGRKEEEKAVHEIYEASIDSRTGILSQREQISNSRSEGKLESHSKKDTQRYSGNDLPGISIINSDYRNVSQMKKKNE